MIDHAGWIIVASIVSMALGAWLHWVASKDNCKSCGISELRTEIRIQSFIQRRLAEKQGLSQEELMEIEVMARQAERK